MINIKKRESQNHYVIIKSKTINSELGKEKRDEIKKISELLLIKLLKKLKAF